MLFFNYYYLVEADSPIYAPDLLIEWAMHTCSLTMRGKVGLSSPLTLSWDTLMLSRELTSTRSTGRKEDRGRKEERNGDRGRKEERNRDRGRKEERNGDGDRAGRGQRPLGSW